MTLENLTVIKNFIVLAGCYGFIKCIKTMFFATAVLAAVMLIRLVNRSRSAVVNYYSMLLLLPMLLSGMSRLFYERPLVFLNRLIFETVTKTVGVIWLSVFLALLFVYVIRSVHQAGKVRSLSLLTEEKWVEEALNAVAVNRLQRQYLKRARVYVKDELISPFSGGVIKPYVVMPDIKKAGLSHREFVILLSHEFIHLSSGHILWLRLYDIAVIWWWIDPLFYFCKKALNEDMEIVCDELCITRLGLSGREYATVMLNMTQLISSAGQSVSAAFFVKDYSVLKNRIAALSRCAKESAESRSVLRKRYTVIFAAAAALLMLAVKLSSYPRYTRMTEVVLYDENIELIDYNSKALQTALKVTDGRLEITDKELFGSILEDNGIEDDYVYLSFDGIMKTPGVGGGGNTGMINTSDFDDIFYLAADTTLNKVMVFALKLL